MILKPFVVVELSLKVLKGFQDTRLVVSPVSCVLVGEKHSKHMVAERDLLPRSHTIPNPWESARDPRGVAGVRGQGEQICSLA